jgi:hypothetical protein
VSRVCVFVACSTSAICSVVCIQPSQNADHLYYCAFGDCDKVLVYISACKARFVHPAVAARRNPELVAEF